MQKGIDYIGIGVSFFCHDGKGSVLMSKRNANARDEHGKWDIGGGGIDFGDTIEQTVYKEITEEYCTEIVRVEFLGHSEVFREHNGQKTHWVFFDYRVQVKPEMARNGEPHKFDEVKWFAFDEVFSLKDLHSQNLKFITKYKEKLLS